MEYKYKVYILILFALLFRMDAKGQSLFNVQNGAVVSFANSSLIRINGDITIENGGTLNIKQSAIIELIGSWINNGTQTCDIDAKVYFVGDAESVIIGGNGTAYEFKSIIIKKDDKSYLVQLDAPISVPDGFLTLTRGTFEIAGSHSLTNTVFDVYEINENSGFILNNGNAIISGQNADFILSGSLDIKNGIFNVGDASNPNNLLYKAEEDAPAPTLSISGEGKLNINSRLSRSGDNDSIRYTQSGGEVYIGNAALSSAANRGMFDISQNSTFNLSGGTIEMQRPSTSSDDYLVQAESHSVSGGLLRFNAQDPSNNTFTINSTVPIGALTILGNNNPVVSLAANFLVLGDIEMNGSEINRFNIYNHNLSLGGDWINNFAATNSFSQSTGAVIFVDDKEQKIRGTLATIFQNISINKTGGKVEQEHSTTINGNLRLLSNTSIFDMKAHDLVIGLNAKIYPDNGSDEKISLFSSTKCIINSSTEILTAPRLIKMLPPTLNVNNDITYHFPLSTPNVYTPNSINIYKNGASFGSNAYIAIKCLPFEHPAAEVSNHSLQKYWAIETNNVTINQNGATVDFYYAASEVRGNEGNWRILYFAPSWDDQNGFWKMDPGRAGDIVEFNQKMFYSVQVSAIVGDWTAGEPDVAFAQYYARKDGNYNDPETWSKQGFNGDASNTAPNKRSDRVRIQDHTVTVTEDTPPAQIISIENGTEERKPGKLRILGEHLVIGDTLKLDQNATLSIGSEKGIAQVPVEEGNVRTNIRAFSSGAIYEYFGSGLQTLGDGLPSTIKSLIVSKESGDILRLSQNISITESLVINNGILDMASATINGNSSGRTFKMLDGELIVRSAFPNNYTAPYLTAGRITFDGAGSVTIPSSGSSPGILQYNDLKICGDNRAGNVTLQSLGEIKIKNLLDISELNFADNSYKFFTNGSTVRFNKNGGVQDIPCKPASPSDTVCFLEYYNLTLDSAGTKQLSASGNPVFKVTNNLKIESGADFTAYNYIGENYNLEIQGNWLNEDGTFNPGEGTVIFNSPVATLSTLINSRDTTANPFHNLIFAGDGIVKSNDNLKVEGNLTISNETTFNLTDKFLSIYGNWHNDDGLFEYGTSTVQFNSKTRQKITRTVGNIQFYNLNINNPESVDASEISAAGNGMIINKDLNLNAGNLITHIDENYRFATVLGEITRAGDGYIDGELRRNIPADAYSYTFPVGYLDVYSPVTVEFTGTGGAAGLISVLSDTVTTSTAPISWADATPTNILPSGSTIDPLKHITRQFTIKMPSGSSFLLGVNRKFNTTFNYLSNDLRNGTNKDLLDFRTYNNNDLWIAPYHYGSFPFIQTRTDNSITINQNVDFGTFILGEPGTLIFYTRASGDWNCRTCWSAQGYGLNSADSYPGDGGNNNYQAFIGDGNTITLNSNISVTGANGHIQVDSSGVLMCDNYTISGNGTFNLGKDATLGIGHANGIRQSGNSGNIQTSGRNFNFENHNRGHFIYTGSLAQTQANEGLPTTIALLRVNKPSNTLTMNRANLTIQDSLYIQSGTLSQGNSTSLTVNGNWVNYGIYNHNNRTVTFSGSKNDTIKAGSTQNFNNLTINKSGGNLYTDQPINLINNLTFGSGNQAVLIAQEPNTYVDVVGASLTRSGSGHVYGELRKNFPRSNNTVTWEVGSDSIHGYRPFELTLTGNNQGTEGPLAVRLFDGIQPNYDSRPASNAVDPAWLVYKYWRLTIPSGSSFSLGTRAANVALQFINPDDLRNGAVPGCFDINLWDGSNWKLFNKTTDRANHGSSYCGDRPIGSHTYSGSDTTVKVTSNMSGSLGTGTLIGDFITGRAVAIPTTTYFSINSGNWSDPNNWSTQGYNGEPAETFPCRFFDIAYIGNGKHITLDMCIGHGDYVTNQTTYEARKFYALRTINVVDNSKLSLGTNYIYCFGINVSNSSTIEVGSLGGIVNYTGSNITTGNIRIASGGYTHFDDTDDNRFIYTAEGETSNFGLFALSNVEPPAGSNTSAWIEKVELQGENNTAINNTSGRNTIPRSGYAFFPYEQATLEAGKSYTIKLTPGGSSSKWKGWIDYDFNGSFDNTNEVAFVQTSASFSERSLAIDVPLEAKPGTTKMRITMWTGSREPGPTNSPTGSNYGNGEVEDYSIKIVNPNYGKLTQSTGSGLPNKFASLTINTNRAGDDVTLGKTVNIDEYLKISNGTLYAGNNNINIYGDFIQEVANGFNSQTSNVIFTGSKANNIEANDPISFNQFRINKSGNEKVNCNSDININNLFAFETDNNLVLNKENTITLEQNCNLTGDFSQNRMIEVDGTSAKNNIVKKFPPLTPPSAPGTYCDASLSGSRNNRYLTNVRVNSWSYSSGDSYYSDFTSQPGPTIAVGSNSITLTRNGGSNSRFAAWIDYNQDGDFADANERLFQTGNLNSNHSATFYVPSGAYNGQTRMRVSVKYDANQNSNGCETSSTGGEYEDYTVTITGATDKPTLSADFLFPLGTDGQYHPADLAFTVGANSTPTISLGLRNQKHPDRLTDNSLDRYWAFSSSGFNGTTTINKLQLRYYNSNITGDIQKYIPGRRRANDWEINLGDDPLAKVPLVADSLLITIQNDDSGISGDYTAGEPLIYFPGRVFYSINTGEWNNKFNWSNDPDLKHGGKAASYFPGMIFEDDTVNIDGHIITFKDSLNITVDSLQIGGTNSFNAQGQLIFGSSPLAKSLTLRQLALHEDGLITGESPGGRQDTIKIKENFINETSTHQGRTGRVILRNDASNSTTLKFIGNDDSQIQGNGNWGEIGDIVLSKAGGLNDTLSINSTSYYSAATAANNYKFHFWSGVFLNEHNKDFKLSTANDMIEMEPNSGIDSRAGRIISQAGLTTNMNTTINIEGGDLIIGNDADEHLLYKTGTSITVKEGKLNIAGGLSRALDNSIVDFSLKNGEVKVNTEGNSEKIGFDLSNAGSSFSMTGGRIIIANQSGTTPLQFDYRVNAQGGSGMEGGVLQCGDTSLTPNNAIIKIGGNLPVYSLHFANDPARELKTEITEEVFNVKGNWKIDANHSFFLSGNTVNLGGDLRNFGSFSAVPVAASASPWQITLNGDNDQVLLSNLAPLELYNLRIDKPADTKVVLSDTGSSNLVLRNTLEFSTNNLAYISAPVEEGRYVEISPISGISQPQILRNGKGHISGRLYMHLDKGIQNVFFPVGGDGINVYRPATVSTIDMDNTAGLLGIINYDSDHPDIENSKLDLSSNIQSYWNVKPKDSGGFALGVDKEFSLKLQFLNPDDIRDNVSPLFLEQRLYSPPCPDPPTVCDGSGTWYEVLTPSRSDTSSGSTKNKDFGDFAIGFPSGVTFYSWKDGDWLSFDTWSLDGYEGAQNKPDRFPDEQYDIVRIGNGKKVTVPKQKSPEVRSVFVEMYDGKPGFLQIKGQTNFIAGASFSLGNDCTIGLEHINGIAPEHETMRGAVLTSIRNYGVSRYIFNSKDGAQATVFPDSIKTIIVDNASTPYNSVFINNNEALKIRDSIIIKHGELQASKNMYLYGTFLIESNMFDHQVINPRFSSLDGIFTFAGTQDKYLILGNRVGVSFHNLNIAGGTVYAIDTLSAENDSSNVKVKSTMNFTGDAIFSLEDGARPLNLIIENSAAGSITGFSSNRFIRTSPSSGYLKRKVAPGLTYNFPVGSLSLDGTANLFAPMTFEAGASGEAGWISARTSKGAKVNGAHLMISSNPEAKFLKRYWTIDSVSAKIYGKWSFTYNDADLVDESDEDDLTKIGRWRPVKEQSPGSWAHPFVSENINRATNTIFTDNNFSWEEFTGDWLIGNIYAFRRIFYSRQTGLWNDPNTWTFIASPPHEGAEVEAGLWPNSEQDSVVIGGKAGVNHIVTLNIPEANVDGVALGAIYPGTLAFQGENALTGKHFNMFNYSTLQISSKDGINSIGNIGNIRSTAMRTFPENGIYEYIGQVNQTAGNALPNTVYGLIINNSGAEGNNLVLLNKNIQIKNNLSILKGIFNLQTDEASGLADAVFSISENARLRITGTKDLSTSLSGYNSYIFDENSYTEFFGSEQTISSFPTNLSRNIGLGNVIVSESSEKKVSDTFKVRGSIWINNNSTLFIDEPKLLQVHKNIINSSIINNSGIIEIGNCD